MWPDAVPGHSVEHKKAGLIPSLLRAACMADEAVQLVIKAVGTQFFFADLAACTILAFLVGADTISAREGAFETHSRFLVLVDDGPTGQLMQALQGSIVRRPGGIVRQKCAVL